VTYFSRNVCAALLASLLLLSTPFSVGATGSDDEDQSNTVNLTIRGGDAKALATCLNVAKEKVRNQNSRASKWDDRGRGQAKKWNDRRAEQENDCENKALATGGSVMLKNVEILTVQENKSYRSNTPDQSNTVNITIRGGDATALATCLNIAKEEGYSRTAQENDCDNKAVAYGGNVYLKNVDITTIQTNKA
jgi:hypothetical protein